MVSGLEVIIVFLAEEVTRTVANVSMVSAFHTKFRQFYVLNPSSILASGHEHTRYCLQ